MRITEYRGRKVMEIENDALLVSVTEEGGHIARIVDKRTGINPLWTPHWESVEPSKFFSVPRPEFGTDKEAQLVAGLLGHNVCLDLFGGATPTEDAAGVPVHGEGPIAPYQFQNGSGDALVMQAILPKAQIRFTRWLTLRADGSLHFKEELENLQSVDRPIGWTQHVTLGAPFLQPGETHFGLHSRLSKVIDNSFNQGMGAQLPDAEFEWPLCPRRDGGQDDLSLATREASSAGFTAHRMEGEGSEPAWFAACNPNHSLLFGYAWRRQDFPWLARWEENHLRPWAPWNGQGYALGMEFGVSPFVADRRAMVARGELFNTPTFRWLGARETVTVEYVAFLREASQIPSRLQWNEDGLEFEFAAEETHG